MPISGPQLRIYASEDFLPSGTPHVPLLYPFWGLPASESEQYVYERFITVGADYFRIVSAREADLFVLPFDWRNTRAFARTEQDAQIARSSAQRFSDLASELGKKLIVFFVGDSDEEVPLPNAIVFRTSLRRGLRQNEFAMAVFFEDFVTQRLGSDLPLRPKLQRPSVGFCGFAGHRLMPDVSTWRRARSIARWVYKGLPAPTVREQAIAHLRRHPSVETDFVLRENAKGAAPVGQAAREAFHRNLMNTDYSLCARRLGNWSVRFYETLAFARIPLFLDTECGLPYDFEINYKELLVWVDHQHVEEVGEELVRYHDSLSPASFKELQRECRLLWEQRLTPTGFFSNFYKHFEPA